MPLLFFDIETEPLPKAELEPMAPMREPFDQNKVKAGNIKDPVKLADKIDACRLAHIVEQDEIQQEFYDRAALSATTGRVLAIGYRKAAEGEVRFLYDGGERTIIEEFWALLSDHTPSTPCGFNILDFDLPFLIRRSWFWEIRTPKWLRDGQWWSRSIIDLRHTWTFGDKRGPGTLGDVAKFFGAPPKLGDGKDFAALFHTNQAAALEYLARDVQLLATLYFRMQQV